MARVAEIKASLPYNPTIGDYFVVGDYPVPVTEKNGERVVETLGAVWPPSLRGWTLDSWGRMIAINHEDILFQRYADSDIIYIRPGNLSTQWEEFHQL